MLEMEKPIAYGSLTDEEIDTLMSQSAKSYADGKCISLEDLKDKLQRKSVTKFKSCKQLCVACTILYILIMAV